MDPPSWVPQRQQQRPPLSLAGPELAVNINAPSPSPSWSADTLRAQPRAPTTQNLTTQVLRRKGVPDADIAPAKGNPELMKQLIIQLYGSGSARGPANGEHAPYGSGTARGQFGYTGQRVHPESLELDDDRARRGAPGWGCLASDDRTGLSPGDIIPHRYDANNSVQANDPSGLFAGPRLGPGSGWPQGLGSPRQQAGITSDQSSYCRKMHDICIRQCEVSPGLASFGPFRACIRTCMHNAGCLDF
jgi:hypothetical protein